MRETAMHDAFLIYGMIANMRHAGYVRSAVYLFECAKAKWMRRVAQPCNVFVGCARAKLRSEAAIALPFERDWLGALTRLESYVVSIS
jgi:hypothetical protein